MPVVSRCDNIFLFPNSKMAKKHLKGIKDKHTASLKYMPYGPV